MIRWTELQTHFSTDQQAGVELMAMAWRQAAERRDEVLNSNLMCNQWNLMGLCSALDWASVQPDALTLEWARSKDGYPPPIPFWVNR